MRRRCVISRDEISRGVISFGVISLGLPLLAACSKDDAVPPRPKVGASGGTASAARAARRAYDGAPPVIPHGPFGASCTSCHGQWSLEVEGMGPSPPSPHGEGAGSMAYSRCEQCHVHRETEQLFALSLFRGLTQDFRRGKRQHPLAPPVIPHQDLLRENCAACHTGPQARREIVCTHPERVRCGQCHVSVAENTEFMR